MTVRSRQLAQYESPRRCREGVANGIVSLYGIVSTPEHARRAAKLASEVGGVRCVNNYLVVGPPSLATSPY